ENHPSYGIRLNNLAQLYQAMGRYEEAEQLMKEVIRIDKASLGENNPSYGRDLNNLASLYQMTSRHEQAEPLMKEAMQIDKEYLGENHPSYGIRLNNLAQLYQAMGRYIEAEALMKEAIHVAKESLGENSNAYGNGLTNLTRLYQAMGLYEKAEPLMNDAYSILKSNLRNNSSYLSENELYQFQNKVIFNLEIYQSINYQSTLSGNVDGAFATNIELYQKNLLLNSVIETRKCIFISGDTSLINSYQTIMSMRKQADKLYSMPIEQRYEDPVVLVEQANNLEKDLRLRSKEYNRSLEDAEIAWKQVQNNLKPYEISIEFVSFAYYNKYWTDSTMYCALILKKGMEFPEMVPLFEQKQLDSLLFGSKIGVNNLYASRGIKSTYIPQLPNGRKLYNLIWKPLEKELRDVKTVYYSPSGLLHQIAFAALPLDSTTYLCDTFNLVQLSSTRQLATSVWQTKPEQITSTALFGGIKYDLDVQETTELKRLLPKNDLALSRGFTSDSTLRSKPYDSLPGTRKEVESIAVMLQASNIKTALYTGISGNEEVFKSLSNQNVSVLHIATHGFFYPDEKEKPQDLDQIMLVGEQKFRYVSNPLRRSGLILAGGNRTWKGEEPVAGMEDGILTAQEISEMNLQNTELVVLSACETGLGDIKGGEGVFGLQRAFKLAGVRTIIMSLWKVDDDATKELMKSFYEKWLGGMDKHDAFRLAKKELKSKHPEPYFWAGFVMLD
ncbi:MAG: CHAT domain-containing protein, partial [Methylococcales bacterium]|nr:CHAT domain-containing protein [Methylococcales bacterium]